MKGSPELSSSKDHPAGSANGNGRATHRLRVLAIGAHPDDIELGCAGTLLAHSARGDVVAMLVMSRGELGPQDSRSRDAEQEGAARILGAELYWGGLEDAAIAEGRETVDVIQFIMDLVRPDVVYTHSPNDSHQDHRSTALATLAAARRSSRVLKYEAPSSLGFSPVLYVDISAHVAGKLAALHAHASQVLRNGLVDLEAMEAQARYRGFQARISVAEAFEVQRFLWDLRQPTELAQPGKEVLAKTFVTEEVG